MKRPIVFGSYDRLRRWLGFTLLSVHFGVIIIIWLYTAQSLFADGGAILLIAFGQLCGFLAAGCALLQFMLMGRVRWLEQTFGLENLAKLHRLNGYATLGFILSHVPLLTLGYAITSETSVWAQYLTFLTDFQSVWLAMIAVILFVSVVVSSIYIVRRHLPYESWRWVHLMVYVAIVLAFWHQVQVGGSFVARPFITGYWYGLYIVVALCVLEGRLLRPLVNFWRFRFRVARVVAETPEAVSIYIGGHNVKRFIARPGQFVTVRILRPGLWLEEHPFSLSALPNEQLRVTVKNAGDYTARLQQLELGTRVIVSGPYGHFTPSPTSRKNLFVAAGVGITPIRSMIEAQNPDHEAILIYGNKTPRDIIFEKELGELSASRNLHVHHIYSQTGEQKRHIDTELIAELVPDFRDREVYICGPRRMMSSVLEGLVAAGLPRTQLHAERFALHPVS